MKTHFIFFIFLLSVTLCNAQDLTKETVDWTNSSIYTASSIKFQSSEMNFECKNCKYFEIKTKSGITGIFILGTGNFNLTNKNLTDSTQACLIRINPADMTSFLKIESKQEFKDLGFKTICINILNDTFKHCFHSGMDALIPANGDYALNFFTKKYGDILSSFLGKKMLVYSFTNNKEL